MKQFRDEKIYEIYASATQYMIPRCCPPQLKFFIVTSIVYAFNTGKLELHHRKSKRPVFIRSETEFKVPAVLACLSAQRRI